MPKGSDDKLSNMYLLLYGQPGVRKTNWALTAAEAGFNVHIFDGDKGAGIVKQLSAKARSRVNIINCFDKQDKPVFAEFLTRYMQNERIWWDDTENKIISQLVNTIEKEHASFQIWSQDMGPNDVVIIDNVRSLVYSVLWNYLQDNSKKIEELEKQDWDAFNFQKLLQESLFTRLRSTPGHVVWVAHEMVNEKSTPGKDDKGKPIRIATGEVETQPMSASRAQGNVMAGYFDDMLYFEIRGSTIYITTKPEEKRQAKARIAFGEWEWSKFQFADYARLAGFTGDWDAESKGCIYHPAGSITERPGLVKRKVGNIAPGNATEAKPEQSPPQAIAATEPKRVGITLRGAK